MARLLRFIPDDDSLVEVTTRTIQSRLLLTPTPQLNRIIIGALARAGRRYEVGVVAFSFLANHFHLLVRVEDAERFAIAVTFFICIRLPWVAQLELHPDILFRITVSA